MHAAQKGLLSMTWYALSCSRHPQPVQVKCSTCLSKQTSVRGEKERNKNDSNYSNKNKPNGITSLDSVTDDGATAGGAEGAATGVAVGLAEDVAVELVVDAAGEGLAADGAREAVGVPVLAAVLAVVAEAARDRAGAARARDRRCEAARVLGAARAPVRDREGGAERAVAHGAAEVPLVPHAPERLDLRARDDRLAALRAHRAPRRPARGAVVRAVQRVVLARRQRPPARPALEVLGVVHLPRARHQLAPRHDHPAAPLAHPPARARRPLSRLNRAVQSRHLLLEISLLLFSTRCCCLVTFCPLCFLVHCFFKKQTIVVEKKRVFFFVFLEKQKRTKKKKKRATLTQTSKKKKK